jgi:predicted nucleic acid-binding protein
MNRPKLYLDTSVISHLFHDDVPDKHTDTLTLWEQLKSGEYEVIISDHTIEELSKSPPELFESMLAKLTEIAITQVDENETTIALAEDYLKYGVLSAKSRDDCRHIAIASVTGCRYILSWNFKHFVNIKTIEKVQGVNKILGYPEVTILPPTMLIEKGDA